MSFSYAEEVARLSERWGHFTVQHRGRYHPCPPWLRSRLFDFLHGGVHPAPRRAYAGKIEVGLAAAGICRRIFELWRKRYPRFVRQFEDLSALRQEVIDAAIHDAARADDPFATRYLLCQQAWQHPGPNGPRFPRNSHPVPWRFTAGLFLGTILNAEAARRRDASRRARPVLPPLDPPSPRSSDGVGEGVRG